MTPVEIIAAIFAIISAIKLITLIVNKGKWLDFVKKVYSAPDIVTVVMAVLALVVLYYLLMELTIVQLFAAICFTSLIFGLELMPFRKDVIKMGEKAIKNNDRPTSIYLFMIGWAILLIWVFKELFF